MAEIWGAAIALGGAVISGYASQKQAKEARQQSKADTKEGAIYSALLSQFEDERADYKEQLGRQRKQRGLDQFKQFSRVGTFAPEYAGDTSRIEVGPEPSVVELLDRLKAADTILNPPKAKKKKRGFLSKVVDPIGLGDKVGAAKWGDPIMGTAAALDKLSGAGKIDTSQQSAYDAQLAAAKATLGG